MELNDSHLGKKDYWDNIYVTELDNYKNNQDDVGEIWFGERTEQKIVDWLVDNVDSDCSLADVGTGNGHLLSLLAEEGFSNLTGIDYSASSIKLAAEINSDHPHIKFICLDVINSTTSHLRHDVCVDKGTYDAISLANTSAADRITYKQRIHSMVTPKTGMFVLASVNWTVEELSEFYSDYFTLDHVLPCKKFTFGGITGQDVSIVIFKPKQTEL